MITAWLDETPARLYDGAPLLSESAAGRVRRSCHAAAPIRKNGDALT